MPSGKRTQAYWTKGAPCPAVKRGGPGAGVPEAVFLCCSMIGHTGPHAWQRVCFSTPAQKQHQKPPALGRV